MSQQVKSNYSMRTINVVSILVPVVVAVLLGIRSKPDLGSWTKVLPHLNAIINSLTALLLLIGYWAINRKDKQAHRVIMTTAFVLGGFFLVFYVIYHLTNQSTSFGGEGLVKYFYYFILISHIALSMVVLPLVLRAFYFAAFQHDYVKHKSIVKYAYPIWLYVSITGVIAYLLISPYYN
ncbi:putative membrane protein [Spirosomataceae bacterium TFI 002]|nr:putative membrane protein [Spirosomataceae bacterium TFI 002]